MDESVEAVRVLLRKGEINFSNLTEVEKKSREILKKLVEETKNKPFSDLKPLEGGQERIDKEVERFRVFRNMSDWGEWCNRIGQRPATIQDKFLGEMTLLGVSGAEGRMMGRDGEVHHCIWIKEKSEEKELLHELQHVADDIVYGDSVKVKYIHPLITTLFPGAVGWLTIGAAVDTAKVLIDKAPLEGQALMFAAMGLMCEGLSLMVRNKYLRHPLEERARETQNRVGS
jgi:hypothetical protein